MAKKSAKRAPRKRELVDTGRDKRHVRRDDAGRFNESDDVGRSLSPDRRRKAKTAAKPGQGDKGDRQTSSSGTAKKTATKKAAQTKS